MTATAAPLAGKTIIMSGGSRGIGLAIALRAARDGANLAIKTLRAVGALRSRPVITKTLEVGASR